MAKQSKKAAQSSKADEQETDGARKKRITKQIMQMLYDEHVSVMDAISVLSNALHLVQSDAPVAMPSEERFNSLY